MDSKVGYVGLGNMGAPMAVNLVRAGLDVRVHDLRAAAVATLEAEGARGAATIEALMAEVDVVCTCVLYDEQVRTIFLGEGGIIDHARPGSVAVIHSTVYPDTLSEIDAAARGRGIHVVDAAVSGGSVRARAGTLTLMVGGPSVVIDRLMPIFDIVGDQIFRVGEVGAGQIVKLGNNMMALVNALVSMEAVRFVESFGVDREQFFEIAQASSGASAAIADWPNLDRYGIEHTLAGTAELPQRIAKDLRYAVSVAQGTSTALPIVALCSQLMPAMMDDRWKAMRRET
jgi:3-hydroxyisobutyrate dehydrogenase